MNIKSKNSFTRYMTGEQPLKPANITNIVAINQGRKPLTMALPKAQSLSVPQVEEMMADGRLIIDCRESTAYGGGHIPGAFNVQLSGGEFEQRVGWVTPDDSRYILLTEKDEDAQKAIHKMAFIGLDSQVDGFVSGGIKAWMKAGKPLKTVGQMDVHTLQHKLNTNGLKVLDVRSPDEWDDGHIAVAHHMNYTAMVPQLTAPAQIGNLTIPKDNSIGVVCATGQRSSTAISLLLRHGWPNLYNVTGGMAAWEDAGFSMVNGEGIACNI
ncbi:MAG: rhodanese-like domain-containing protein [Anaerolineae bacterium]